MQLLPPLLTVVVFAILPQSYQGELKVWRGPPERMGRDVSFVDSTPWSGRGLRIGIRLPLDVFINMFVLTGFSR